MIINIINIDSPETQCVICNKTFSNSCLEPTKLKRHLVTNHPDHKDKPLEFVKKKLVELKKDQFSMKKVAKTTNEKATEASYKCGACKDIYGKRSRRGRFKSIKFQSPINEADNELKKHS